MLLIALVILLLAPDSAHAWYKHQALMPMVLGGKPLVGARILGLAVPPSCGSDYAGVMAGMIRDLGLNPSLARAPSPFEAACRQARLVTGAEILSGPSVDDPDDSGMDEDLPNSADPRGDRRWLGGSTGPSSKGFRHFYYGGWNPLQPIASFQIPAHAIGIAPERAGLIGARARAALRAGPKYVAWGYRLLGWTLHYLQDLTQPFHASQDLSPLLMPWKTLLVWPPWEHEDRFLQEAYRIVTNYHWALEGYVLDRAKLGEESPWSDCLGNPESFWTIPNGIAGANPKAGDEQGKRLQLERVARGIASASRDLALELGSRLRPFFGSDLTVPGASMPLGTVTVDYGALAIRPDLDQPREALHQTVCKALANTAWATTWLLQWAGAP